MNPYVPVDGTQGLGEPGLGFAGRAVDLDMDGKVDFLYPRLNDGARAKMGATLLQSTGATFTPFENPDHEIDWSIGTFFNADYVGDFDGDGLPDIVRPISASFPGSEGIGVWGFRRHDLQTGFAAYQPLTWILTDPVLGFSVTEYISANAGWNAYAVDTDGDGKVELLFRDARPRSDPEQFTTSRMLALTKFASGGSDSPVRTMSLKGSGRFSDEVRYQMVDVNGDGLADAVEIPNIGGTQIRIAINNGRISCRRHHFLFLRRRRWANPRTQWATTIVAQASIPVFASWTTTLTVALTCS